MMSVTDGRWTRVLHSFLKFLRSRCRSSLTSAQSWNWAVSVEPCRATVEDWPWLTTVETTSK